MARHKNLPKMYDWDAHPVLWEYEPGNCTRYVLLFTPVPEAAAMALGYGSRPIVHLSWVNSGSGGNCGACMFVDPDSLLHYAYVMEKMECNSADAKALVKACELQLGVEGER